MFCCKVWYVCKWALTASDLVKRRLSLNENRESKRIAKWFTFDFSYNQMELEGITYLFFIPINSPSNGRMKGVTGCGSDGQSKRLVTLRSYTLKEWRNTCFPMSRKKDVWAWHRWIKTGVGDWVIRPLLPPVPRIFHTFSKYIQEIIKLKLMKSRLS